MTEDHSRLQHSLVIEYKKTGSVSIADIKTKRTADYFAEYLSGQQEIEHHDPIIIGHMITVMGIPKDKIKGLNQVIQKNIPLGIKIYDLMSIDLERVWTILRDFDDRIIWDYLFKLSQVRDVHILVPVMIQHVTDLFVLLFIRDRWPEYNALVIERIIDIGHEDISGILGQMPLDENVFAKMIKKISANIKIYSPGTIKKIGLHHFLIHDLAKVISRDIAEYIISQRPWFTFSDHFDNILIEIAVSSDNYHLLEKLKMSPEYSLQLLERYSGSCEYIVFSLLSCSKNLDAIKRHYKKVKNNQCVVTNILPESGYSLHDFIKFCKYDFIERTCYTGNLMVHRELGLNILGGKSCDSNKTAMSHRRSVEMFGLESINQEIYPWYLKKNGDDYELHTVEYYSNKGSELLAENYLLPESEVVIYKDFAKRRCINITREAERYHHASPVIGFNATLSTLKMLIYHKRFKYFGQLLAKLEKIIVYMRHHVSTKGTVSLCLTGIKDHDIPKVIKYKIFQAILDEIFDRKVTIRSIRSPLFLRGLIEYSLEYGLINSIDLQDACDLIIDNIDVFVGFGDLINEFREFMSVAQVHEHKYWSKNILRDNYADIWFGH